MPLLARTTSLPFSTHQATALKPRVYPLGPDRPEAGIGISERVDFHVGQLHAPLAQGAEGFDRWSWLDALVKRDELTSDQVIEDRFSVD